MVIAFNVLHHFNDWRGACDAVFKLGDNLIIETPGPDDINACNQKAIPDIYNYLDSKNPKLIAQTLSHTTKVTRPMWYFNTPKTTITKAYIDVPNHNPPLGEVAIIANNNEKHIYFQRKKETKPWIKGINLRTYQKFNGVFPSRDDIAYCLEFTVLPEKRHGDIFPWNFILAGDYVELIDGGDDKALYDDKKALAKTIKEIRGKKAFLVIGAESTGTKLVTDILVKNGCKGDYGHRQEFDHSPKILKDNDLVVWRRSFPHDGNWPNLSSLVNLLKGYRITVIVTMRDWYSTSRSNINIKRVDNVEASYDLIQDAYLRIFQQIIDNKFEYHIVNYDSLIAEPKEYQKILLQSIHLPIKELVNITNQNRKYYHDTQ